MKSDTKCPAALRDDHFFRLHFRWRIPLILTQAFSLAIPIQGIQITGHTLQTQPHGTDRSNLRSEDYCKTLLLRTIENDNDNI